MTMPNERTRSVLRTRELLQMLASGSDVADMDELWCATIMKSAVATTMMAGGEESKAA